MNQGIGLSTYFTAIMSRAFLFSQACDPSLPYAIKAARRDRIRSDCRVVRPATCDFALDSG